MSPRTPPGNLSKGGLESDDGSLRDKFPRLERSYRVSQSNWKEKNARNRSSDSVYRNRRSCAIHKVLMRMPVGSYLATEWFAVEIKQ